MSPNPTEGCVNSSELLSVLTYHAAVERQLFVVNFYDFFGGGQHKIIGKLKILHANRLNDPSSCLSILWRDSFIVIPLPGFSNTNVPVLLLLDTGLIFPPLSAAPAEDFELFLLGRCVSAEAAAVFAAGLDFGFLSTFDAADAAFALVTSLDLEDDERLTEVEFDFFPAVTNPIVIVFLAI